MNASRFPSLLFISLGRPLKEDRFLAAPSAGNFESFERNRRDEKSGIDSLGDARTVVFTSPLKPRP